MIIIHATFHVNPAKQDVFLQEIQPLIAASREEEGNFSYCLQKDLENENVYTMVEIWQDMQAVTYHNSTEHFNQFVGKANNLLTAPIDIKAYEGQQLDL